MRRRNREINIFNMSLLDILCGALGAFCFMMLAAIPYYGNKGKAEASPQKEQQQQSSNNQGQYSENPEELKQQLQDLQKRYEDSEMARNKLDVRFPVTYAISWSCDPSARTPETAVDADVYVEDDFKNESNGQSQPRFDPMVKQEAYWPGDYRHDAQGVGPRSEGQGEFWSIRDLPRGAPLRVFVKFFFPSNVVGSCTVDGVLISDKAGTPEQRTAFAMHPWLYLGTFKRGADDKVEFKSAQEAEADAVFDRVDGSILAAANKNDPKAQYYIGVCKLWNVCLKQETTGGIAWLEKSAKQGYDPAIMELGDAYFSGKNVKQDYAVAAKWLQKAAEKGIARAQFYLGALTHDGIGTEKNLKLAIDLTSAAANAGFPFAQYMLGHYYAAGDGVERDPYLALEWNRRSAENGNTSAQLFLAQAFDAGVGTTANAQVAFDWMKKSADGGIAEAQALLAQWYYTGHNVGRDEKLGAEWAKRAADQGNEDAKKLLQTKGQSAVNANTGSKESNDGK